jgi:Tfp pilus assembly protein PilV
MIAGSYFTNGGRCSHGAARSLDLRTAMSNVSAPREPGYNIHNFGCKKSIEVANATCGCEAFTLAEILVSVFVLGIIVFMVAQLMTSATAITRTGHKYIDTDTQARAVFDRMALDFAQMLKRSDVDYYLKQKAGYNGHGNGHGWGHTRTTDLGSDQIAFFSQVPGYNSTGSSFQSPISLVAYRVNQDDANASTDPGYLKLQRMGKTLLWNGASNGTNTNAIFPIVFFPQTIASVSSWSAAINNFQTGNVSISQDEDYETIGPGVFRFEYYYLLKNGYVTDWPWDRRDMPDQQTITNPINIGLTQIEAIAVTIAVIDQAGRALITPVSLADLAVDMADFKSARGRGVGAQKIGDLEAQWKSAIEAVISTGLTNTSGFPVPAEAAKGIRIYNRYFDLKTF